MTNSPYGWRLLGDKATFECAVAQGSLEMIFPSRGIHLASVLGHEVNLRLLGAVCDAPILDRYVRENELVVHYAETPASRLRTEVVWQLGALNGLADGGLYLEQRLSTQTSFLDGSPEIGVRFTLPAGSSRELRKGCWMTSVGSLQLALFTQPQDVVDFTWSETDEGDELQLQVFDGHLEKGVIRRGKVGLFICEESQAHTIGDLHDAFAQAPPPLAT